jgi:hypothetical protein
VALSFVGIGVFADQWGKRLHARNRVECDLTSWSSDG